MPGGSDTLSTVPLVMAVLALAVWLLVRRTWDRRRRPGPGRRPRRVGHAPAVGELWFAWVPFEDGTGGKDRPVLVLATGWSSCSVARFTSQDKQARRDHVRVPDGMPGLTRVSWVSLRPLEVPTAHLRRRIGAPGEALVAWYRQQA